MASWDDFETVEAPPQLTPGHYQAPDPYGDADPVSPEDQALMDEQHGYSGKPATTPQADPWAGFETVGQTPVYESQGLATNFAGEDDLEAYRQAKANGATEEEALQVGDNGIGNDQLGGIKTPNVYGAAVPEDVLRQSLGNDPAAWRRARAEVWMNGQKRLVPIVDLGPGQSAQARGVTTDITAPLSNGLGGSGMDPVTTRIIPEAGPDYTQDQAAWWKEQHQIEASMPGAKDWSAFPTVDEPDNQSPQVVQTPSQNVSRGTTTADASATAALNEYAQTPQQQPKPDTTNPWDLGKAWQNLFGYGSQAAAGLDVAGYKEALNRAESGEPKPTLFGVQEEEDRKALANPNISQADAEEIIARRRAATQMDQAIAQKQLSGAEANQEAAVKATPGPDYQRTIPGTITRFLGQSAPFLMSGALGPAGPLAMANQMSEQGYGDTFDRTYAQGKEAHPDWTDEQLRQAADRAGRVSAQTGFENGVVLGLLPVPKVGPLIARMVEQVGLRGAYMTVVGASQDIEQNIEVNKVDPRQAIYEGVLQHAPANFFAGAAFGVPEAIGEAAQSFTRPGAVPEPAQDRTQPETAAPLGSSEQSQQQGQGVSNQPQGGAVPVERGAKVAPVEENGEETTVRPNEEARGTTEPTPEATPSGGEAEPGGIPPMEEHQDGETPPGTAQEEPRRPAEELSDSDRQQIVNRVRSGLETALNKFRPLFNALGVPVTEDSRYGALVTPTENGSVAGFNAAHLADNLYQDWLDGGTHYADQGLINDTVEHELIHAAWIDTQRRRWIAGGRQVPWLTFHYLEASGIDEAIQDAAREARRVGNDDLANLLEKGTESGLSLYTYGHDSSELSSAQRAAEIVRQLVQLKVRNRITEDFNQGVFRNLLSHIQNFYETARSRLVELWNQVRSGTSGVHQLELAVNETDQRLSEIGYLKGEGQVADHYQRPARPEDRPLQGDISYHGPGRLAEKIVLPNRDVVARQPHTEELIRDLDEFRAREGELHGRVAELNNLWRSLSARVDARANRLPFPFRRSLLATEIDQIGKYAEAHGTLPANMSPEAKIWLNAANNGLYREIGDRMRAGNFKVVLPDGSTRAFIGAPKNVIPFPRVIRPDVQRILSGAVEDANGNLTPDADKLYKEGVQKGFFKNPDDLKAWARQYRLDHADRPMTTNLERARVTKLPSFFYTYSPQAMLDRLFWQASELARLETFGQKLPGQQDAFDRAAAAINADMTMSGAHKQHAFEAIESLRKTIYGQNKRSWGIRLLRGASSAGLAGSPHTSAKIGLSMLFNVPAYRGLARTLQGIAFHVFQHSQSIAELRRLGLKSDTLTNLHDDPYSVQTAEQRASNIFTGVLKLAGHALAQDVGKAVTARASRLWLEDAIEKLQADPSFTSSRTKQIAQDIQRRGIDPRLFTQSQIDPKLKDRFVREDVQDLQTAYRSEDYPAWQAAGMGSVMFQFGHWAYNSARAITRDAVIPMARAYGNGDVLLGTRYFGRLVGISLAAAGAAEAWRELDKLFGREANVATIGEIMGAFTRDNPDAAHMLVSRLQQDIVTSPVIGMYGDIANVTRDISRGAAGETHFFNPASPAAVGYLSIIERAINQVAQQGGHLSNRQVADFANQLAGLAKGYYDVANTVAGATEKLTGAHLPIPGESEAMGRRENSFVKSRLDLFYEMNPAWDKRMKGSTFPGNVHTPYLQNLNEALLSGNVQDARTITNQMRVEQKLTPQQLTTTLRESIDGHRPIPTGQAGQAFMRWARYSLTPDEVSRMRQIQRVYVNTAQRAGLPVQAAEQSSGSNATLMNAINSLRGP
jgi:hypothetical protein